MLGLDLNVIIVALISLGTPIFLWLQNRSNNKRQEKLDSANTQSQALDRAKVIYEDLINTLENQAKSLRDTIDNLEKDLDEEQEENDKLRQRVRELEDKIDDLENQLYHAKLQLARMNVASEPTEQA